MSIEPFPNLEIQQDQFQTLLPGPPGSAFIYSYTYSSLYSLPTDEEVGFFSKDFYLPFRADLGIIRNLVGALHDFGISQGVEVMGLFLYEKPVLELFVPDRICLSIFGQDPFCFTPPQAGAELTLAYQYRLYLILRDLPVGGMAFRPAIAIALTAPVILALAALIIITLLAVAGVQQVWTGKMTFAQLIADVRTLGKVPGENVAAAITPPLALGGIGFAAIGALGIFGAAIIAARAGKPAPPPPPQPTFGGTVSGGVGRGPVHVNVTGAIGSGGGGGGGTTTRRRR